MEQTNDWHGLLNAIKRHTKHSWAGWLIPVIPAAQATELGRSWSEASPGKISKTLTEKQAKANRIGGMAQVVQCLPSQCEVLSFIPRKRQRRTPCMQQV
jgi:hypothetical protein